MTLVAWIYALEKFYQTVKIDVFYFVQSIPYRTEF